MKAVIIAGGKGSRLGGLVKNTPKPMIKIGPWSVLEHQIRLLAKSGVRDIWILLGFKGNVISDYFGSGKKWGVKIHYSQEKAPLGTAGAVKSIADKLREDFLVLYGDVMVNFDVQNFIRFHRGQPKNSYATIVVHPNDHPFESDLVEVQNSRVVRVHPKPHTKKIWQHNLVSAATYILSPKIFSYISKKQAADFGKDVFPKLLKKNKVINAYRTWEYFKDMGTPKQLRSVRRDYDQGIVERLNYQYKQKAIFLDRDGVINEEIDGVISADSLKVFSFSAEAIRKINKSFFHAIVITNQAYIAKGQMKEKELDDIHRKLETEIGRAGAKLDAIYFCPHHPEKGWPGEIKKLKIQCSCRKPKIGLIKRAAKDFNLDLKECYFIGDSMRFDYLCAKNSKVKFIGVLTGKALRDWRQKTPKKVTTKRNLRQSVDWILSRSSS